MTIQDVAWYTGLSWNTVKEIDKKHLKTKYKRIELRKVRYIAIDEFAISKGHRYMTVVMDLETRRAIYIKEGKSSHSLKEFWRRVKKAGAKLKAVAIDMSPAYISAVTKHVGYDKIVFDWFHIKKKINFEIDELRRTLYADEQRLAIRKVIKGTRWLLLKNADSLIKDKNEDEKLRMALQMNKPLATMYYMKEELTDMWWYKSKRESEMFLNGWIKRATNSGIRHLVKVGQMIGAYKSAILRWFDFEINLSTGPLEGFNNKIKVLKRKAYGFKDTEYFGLKILDLHNIRNKYAIL